MYVSLISCRLVHVECEVSLLHVEREVSGAGCVTVPWAFIPFY